MLGSNRNSIEHARSIDRCENTAGLDTPIGANRADHAVPFTASRAILGQRIDGRLVLIGAVIIAEQVFLHPQHL